MTEVKVTVELGDRATSIEELKYFMKDEQYSLLTEKILGEHEFDMLYEYVEFMQEVEEVCRLDYKTYNAGTYIRLWD